jgi:hypothetical protein
MTVQSNTFERRKVMVFKGNRLIILCFEMWQLMLVVFVTF